MDKSKVKSNLKWFNVICAIIAEIWKALSTQHPLRRWLFLKDRIYFIHYGSVCDYLHLGTCDSCCITDLWYGAWCCKDVWSLKADGLLWYCWCKLCSEAKKVTQHWIWYELLLLVAVLAQPDNKGTWKLNCCLTVVPFEKEGGIPELYLLLRYSRHTKRE